MRAEQVRRWRSAARSGGIAALRPRPGRAPRKREATLSVARDPLAAPVADRPVWTLARLAAEVAARTGATISPGHPSVVLRRGLPLAPAAAHPRGPSGRGRGVDRAGLRLKLLKRQAAAGDIHLLFGGRGRGAHPSLPRSLTAGRSAGPTCGPRRRAGQESARSSACSTTPDAS